MSLFSSISRNFLQTMEKRAAVRVHEYLQHVDTSLMIQAGISPELFDKGPAAYPWRQESSSELTQVVSLASSNETAIREGISELKACSDAELNDLGITRGSIADVVRLGRPGVEQVAPKHDRQAAA